MYVATASPVRASGAGVGAVVLRTPRLVRRGGRVARGVGEYPGQPCYDPNRPAWFPYWASSPEELMCVLGEGAAAIYQRVQYGAIPTVAELGTPPAPNAPQTQAEMETPGAFTPDQAYMTPEQWTAYQQRQRDVLNAAAASGAWNPEGRLPTVDLWGKYGVLLLAVGVGVGGAVLLSRAGRR